MGETVVQRGWEPGRGLVLHGNPGEAMRNQPFTISKRPLSGKSNSPPSCPRNAAWAMHSLIDLKSLFSRAHVVACMIHVCSSNYTGVRGAASITPRAHLSFDS